MKKIIILAAIIMTFGGCSTHKKVLKTQSDLKVQNDSETKSNIQSETNLLKVGKSDLIESATVEEINIKQPHSIELTANFRIDSNATLRGDTALKLVDVADKNISVTIYQNGKNGQLTAQIKSKNSVKNVPFSEILIKKSSTNRVVKVDTSKSENIMVHEQTQTKDKSKIEVKETKVNKDIKTNNNFLIIGAIVLILIIAYFYGKY